MTELERALVLIGRQVDVPATPLRIERVVGERIARRRRQRRAAAIALAAALAALAVAFAVPEARSAILRFFHIGAVTVERVHTLPHATHAAMTAGLGEPLAREDAERGAGFRARLGHATTPPGPWYARPGLLATVLHGDVLLVEIEGEQAGLVKKLSTARVEPADVNGTFALWIPGRHVLIYDSGGAIRRIARYSGSALIWERRGLTFRLEGEPDRTAALAEARKITP